MSRTNKRTRNKGKIDTLKSMLKDPRSLASEESIAQMQVLAAKRSI